MTSPGLATDTEGTRKEQLGGSPAKKQFIASPFTFATNNNRESFLDLKAGGDPEAKQNRFNLKGATSATTDQKSGQHSSSLESITNQETSSEHDLTIEAEGTRKEKVCSLSAKKQLIASPFTFTANNCKESYLNPKARGDPELKRSSFYLKGAISTGADLKTRQSSSSLESITNRTGAMSDISTPSPPETEQQPSSHEGEKPLAPPKKLLMNLPTCLDIELNTPTSPAASAMASSKSASETPQPVVQATPDYNLILQTISAIKNIKEQKTSAASRQQAHGNQTDQLQKSTQDGKKTLFVLLLPSSWP